MSESKMTFEEFEVQFRLTNPEYDDYLFALCKAHREYDPAGHARLFAPPAPPPTVEEFRLFYPGVRPFT